MHFLKLWVFSHQVFGFNYYFFLNVFVRTNCFFFMAFFVTFSNLFQFFNFPGNFVMITGIIYFLFTHFFNPKSISTKFLVRERPAQRHHFRSKNHLTNYERQIASLPREQPFVGVRTWLLSFSGTETIFLKFALEMLLSTLFDNVFDIIQNMKIVWGEIEITTLGVTVKPPMKICLLISQKRKSNEIKRKLFIKKE